MLNTAWKLSLCLHFIHLSLVNGFMTTFEKASSQQKLWEFAGEVMTHKSLLFLLQAFLCHWNFQALLFLLVWWVAPGEAGICWQNLWGNWFCSGQKPSAIAPSFPSHRVSEVYGSVTVQDFWFWQKKHILHFIAGHNFLCYLYRTLFSALWCFHIHISIHTSSTSIFVPLSRVFQRAFQQWEN